MLIRMTCSGFQFGALKPANLCLTLIALVAAAVNLQIALKVGPQF